MYVHMINLDLSARDDVGFACIYILNIFVCIVL